MRPFANVYEGLETVAGCVISASVWIVSGSVGIVSDSENSLAVSETAVDISHILGNLITVIFDYQILRKPLKILSL